MKSRQLLLLRLCLALSDLILLNVCLFIGFHLSNKYGMHLNQLIYQDSILAVSIIWLLASFLFRLYDEYTVYVLKDIYRAKWRSIALHSILFLSFLALRVRPNFPVYFMLSFYGLVVIAFIISRFAAIILKGTLRFNFNMRNANILAIASIGGHWIQLMRLMPLFAENSVTFASNKANLKETIQGHKFHLVPDANKDDKMMLIKCSASVFWYVLSARPQVIITTGAAPGLLAILMGKVLGIKTIWIDSIANVEKLSLSGNIAVKIADRVYTQWAHLATPKIIFSGNVL
jgi:hypothetical protein